MFVIEFETQEGFCVLEYNYTKAVQSLMTYSTEEDAEAMIDEYIDESEGLNRGEFRVTHVKNMTLSQKLIDLGVTFDLSNAKYRGDN